LFEISHEFSSYLEAAAIFVSVKTLMRPVFILAMMFLRRMAAGFGMREPRP
jgi:hypothetical protein